ncbi:MAG: hypothetical protein Q9227_007899, partial [Pyrenula ochraceoflavens]
NPFAKREQFGAKSLVAYKALTILTWLLVIVVGVLHTFWAPPKGHHHRNRTIWNQNSHYHTPFALNSAITSLYWILLLLFQGAYIYHLYSANEEWVKHAANVGSHFIFHNLLTFGFIMLWVRGHFWQAELLTIVNFIQLSALYFRHSTTPRVVHIGAVSGPLAWNFTALFWDGAVMVNAHHLAARIVANIFIWAFLGYGLFFLGAYKDYTMGFELSLLMLSMALSQLATKVFALQWIFAFAIMGVLFFFSLVIGVPGIFGKEISFRREQAQGSIVSEDRERQPLLQDE